MAPQPNSKAILFQPWDLVIISILNLHKLFKSEVFLRQKYLTEMLSTKQIASIISAARSTVAKYLKQYGVALRPEDEAHKLRKGQLAYGEKIVKGQLMAHKREIEALEKMRELRKLGLSYWKIASVLNTMKIPTKNGKGKWHPTTIMNILKAHGHE